MLRCTDEILVTKCQHPEIYSTTFEADVVEPGLLSAIKTRQIVGKFVMEYWDPTTCERKADKDKEMEFHLVYQQRNATVPKPETERPDPLAPIWDLPDWFSGLVGDDIRNLRGPAAGK